jgi:hypothetical protein
MNMDSWIGVIGGKKKLARGGAPFNMDWNATRESVKRLADLRPSVVGCGHGIPMRDGGLPDRLQRFADRFRPIRHGRYAARPAVADEAGIVTLPPAPFDPVPLATAGALLAVGIALGSGYLEEQLRD